MLAVLSDLPALQVQTAAMLKKMLALSFMWSLAELGFRTWLNWKHHLWLVQHWLQVLHSLLTLICSHWSGLEYPQTWVLLLSSK